MLSRMAASLCAIETAVYLLETMDSTRPSSRKIDCALHGVPRHCHQSQCVWWEFMGRSRLEQHGVKI